MNEPHEQQQMTSARGAGTTGRREAMLHELVAAMHELHRRKRRRKRIAAMLTLTMLLGGVLVLALARPAPQQLPQVAQTTEPQAQPQPQTVPATEPQPRRVEIVLVRTDPDILQRYAAPDPPRLVQMIDDDELLATLADIDRPTGLVRTAGAVWLTAAVTDEELRSGGVPRPQSRSRDGSIF